MHDSLDAGESLRRGAIGAFGALPGTLAAHPVDVIKMKQQVSGAGVAAAVRGVGGPFALYNGVSFAMLAQVRRLGGRALHRSARQRARVLRAS